jgi:hypothetical protein
VRRTQAGRGGALPQPARPAHAGRNLRLAPRVAADDDQET